MPKSGFNACVAFFLLPVEIAFRWFMRNLRELPLARSKYHGEVTFIAWVAGFYVFRR